MLTFSFNPKIQTWRVSVLRGLVDVPLMCPRCKSGVLPTIDGICTNCRKPSPVVQRSYILHALAGLVLFFGMLIGGIYFGAFAPLLAAFRGTPLAPLIALVVFGMFAAIVKEVYVMWNSGRNPRSTQFRTAERFWVKEMNNEQAARWFCEALLAGHYEDTKAIQGQQIVNVGSPKAQAFFRAKRDSLPITLKAAFEDLLFCDVVEVAIELKIQGVDAPEVYMRELNASMMEFGTETKAQLELRKILSSEYASNGAIVRLVEDLAAGIKDRHLPLSTERPDRQEASPVLEISVPARPEIRPVVEGKPLPVRTGDSPENIRPSGSSGETAGPQVIQRKVMDERKERGDCIMCGKPLSGMYRFWIGPRHEGCKEFRS